MERVFFIGWFVGIMLSAVVVNFTSGATEDHVKSLIRDCERELPRNQNCVIVALPVSKD